MLFHGLSNEIVDVSRSTSPPKYGLSLWPFTVQLAFVAGSSSSTAPYGFNSLMMKGPDHLDFNLPGKSLESGIEKQHHLSRLELSLSKLLIMVLLDLFFLEL